jgi:hypothetical protein
LWKVKDAGEEETSAARAATPAIQAARTKRIVDAPFDFIKSVTASGCELPLNHGESFHNQVREEWTIIRELTAALADIDDSRPTVSGSWKQGRFNQGQVPARPHIQ